MLWFTYRFMQTKKHTDLEKSNPRILFALSDRTHSDFCASEQTTAQTKTGDKSKSAKKEHKVNAQAWESDLGGCSIGPEVRL